jgi:tRNA-modifying protein YgfZ
MTQATVVSRIDRDLVVAKGPDATKFLQSLLSQDLDPVAVDESTHALLLEPKGKLVVDLRAARVADDEWWCVCEAGFGPVLAQGLNRFKIRVKVDIEDRSANVAAIALRGPDAIEIQAKAFHATELIASIQNDWAAAPGFEFVGEPAAIDALAAKFADAGAVPIDRADYEMRRVEAGVPRQGYDIDESTIAQEAFLERDAVSFTKGCFLGQELVCRIDTRGHVNRLLRRLRSDAPIERGASVVVDDKEVGTVTTSAGNVALATIRRAVEPGSDVVVRSATGDVTARIEAVAAVAS